MRGPLVVLTLVFSVVCAACGGAANPAGPLPFTARPAGLDRVVEDSGGGGAVCIPAPCPGDPRGVIRVDAGDADFSGRTDVVQSGSDPYAFVARTDLTLLAGHFSDGTATLDVSNRTMSASLSLVGPNGEMFEVSGESAAQQTEEIDNNCPSRRTLTTTSTFIFRYLGRTVITETHCLPG